MTSAFTFEDGAAYHQPSETLILGDLHLGRTYSQPNRAYPEPEYNELRPRLAALLDSYNPSAVILNGDTLDTMPPEDEAVDFLVDVFDGYSTMLTTGNHDDSKKLLQAALPSQFEVADETTVSDNIVVFHGHRTPTTPATTFVINHVHPRADGKRCTLYKQNATYNTAVIILPTFSAASTGSEYSNQSRTAQSPVIRAGEPLSSYDVVATSDDERLPKR